MPESKREGEPLDRSQPRPRVLVIDDDDVPRAAMCELLEGADMEPIALQSPIGATQVAITRGVDVVVIDVMMPNLRGDMLAKLFRKNPRLRHVGVLLVSGCSSQELTDFARACEADAVLGKGELRTDLVPTARRVLSTVRMRQTGTDRGAETGRHLRSMLKPSE